VKLRFIVVAAMTCSLSACVSWFYTPGLAKLGEYCQEDAGYEVTGSVEVEGYFAASKHACEFCWKPIVEDGYQYLEFYNTETSAGSPFRHEGLYRLENAERTSEQCHEQLDRVMKQHGKRMQSLQNYLAHQCIKASLVEEKKSLYAVSFETSNIQVNGFHSSILVRSESRTWEITSNRTLSNSIYYSLYPWPKSSLDYSRKFGCEDLGRRPKLSEVLVPKK